MVRRTNDDDTPSTIGAQIIADRDGKPSFAVVPFDVFVALTAYARRGVEASRDGEPGNFRGKEELDSNSRESVIAALVRAWAQVEKDVRTILADRSMEKTFEAVSEWLSSDRNFAASEADDAGELDEDLAVYDVARVSDEERFPAAVADRLIAGESPLKVFREHRGLTQGQLAEAAKTTAPYLSQIENGRRTGSVGLLHRLADALRVEIDDLV